MNISTRQTIRPEQLSAIARLAALRGSADHADFLRSFRHTLRNRAAVLHGRLELARLDGIAEDALRDVACAAQTFDAAIAALDRMSVDGAELSRWLSGATSARRPRGASPHAAQSADGDEGAGDGLVRIMIADDEPDIRSSLSEMLRGLGHEVRTAADGEAALTLARQWQPDVVLLDVFMPRMSGFVVARLLRLQFERAHMRIVMMTGYPVDESTLENAGEAGFDLCLDKTFTMEVLKEAVAPNPPAADFGPGFTSG